MKHQSLGRWLGWTAVCTVLVFFAWTYTHHDTNEMAQISATPEHDMPVPPEEDMEDAPIPLKLESEIPFTIERGATEVSFSAETVGTMFFEASFYIEVVDESGALVYQGLATATDEWMTEAYVPFTASLVRVADPMGEFGSMIFHRDDPSGIHPYSFEIPVVFLEV